MSLKAAFIFVAPHANPAEHQAQVTTSEVAVTTFAVADYAQAEALVPQLIQQGFVAIELCAGFGHEGVARVKRAAAGRIPVGAVRFDCHPGLEFQSGDSLFN